MPTTELHNKELHHSQSLRTTVTDFAAKNKRNTVKIHDSNEIKKELLKIESNEDNNL